MKKPDPDKIRVSSTVVAPRGPQPARLYILGESPGKTETFKTRVAFTGKSGAALDDWLFALMPGRPVRINNLIDRRAYDPETNEDAPPPQWAIEAPGNEARIIQDIIETQPDVIAPCGTSALTWLCGDVGGVMINGGVQCSPLPKHSHWLKLAGWPRIVPFIHPAAGLRDDSLLTQSYLGLARATGCPGLPNIRHLLDGGVGSAPLLALALDTEGTADNPVSMSWSSPYAGSGVRWFGDKTWNPTCPDQKALGLYQVILLHYALHDWPILKRFGLDLDRYVEDGGRVFCTMYHAWHCNEPFIGLKELTYRWFRKERKSYADIVGPHLAAAWVEWWGAALAHAATYQCPETILTKSGKPSKFRDGRIKTRLAGPDWAMEACSDTAIRKVCDGELDGDHQKLRQLYLDLSDEAQIQLAVVGEIPPPMETALLIVPRDEAEQYGADDAIDTLAFAAHSNCLHPDTWPLAWRVDQEILPMLADMESRGLRADFDRAQAIWVEISEEVRDRTGKVRTLLPVGYRDINLQSRDQLAEAIFSPQGLGIDHTGKRTKTGKLKMDDTVLSQLQRRHPIIPAYLDFVEATTLLNMFATPLLDLAAKAQDRAGLIFPRIKYTVIPSARYATEDPNFMAFPARTKLGAKIRGVFVARDGMSVISCDQSQIELRAMAAMSGDPVMVQAFRDGADLHRITADACGVTRNDAKTVNFAIIYLVSDEGLYDQMAAAEAQLVAGLTREQGVAKCHEVKAAWFDKYHGVTDYVKRVAAFMRNNGYIVSPSGRVWHLPATLFTDPGMEYALEAAIRQGTNFTIQEPAQLGMKEGMLAARRDLRELGLYKAHYYPTLQIHDEMLGDVTQGLEEDVGEVIKQALCTFGTGYDNWFWDAEVPYTKIVRVPVGAEYKYGADWSQAK